MYRKIKENHHWYHLVPWGSLEVAWHLIARDRAMEHPIIKIKWLASVNGSLKSLAYLHFREDCAIKNACTIWGGIPSTIVTREGIFLLHATSSRHKSWAIHFYIEMWKRNIYFFSFVLLCKINMYTKGKPPKVPPKGHYHYGYHSVQVWYINR